MTLNDNAIDYVHWNDINEWIVYDCSKLRVKPVNAHDNEMLSIIEELREAGISRN